MSRRRLVIDELLAFVQEDIDTPHERNAFRICSRTYSTHEIINSRRVLYGTLGLEFQTELERGVESTAETQLQDIFDCFKRIDKMVQPIFVARDWRKLPMVKASDSIIKTVIEGMTKIDKSLDKMKEIHGVKEISRSLHQLQEKLKSYYMSRGLLSSRPGPSTSTGVYTRSSPPASPSSTSSSSPPSTPPSRTTYMRRNQNRRDNRRRRH